jgi:hypothetical protein
MIGLSKFRYLPLNLVGLLLILVVPLSANPSIERSIRDGFSGLPPVPASLKPLVEKLKGSGYAANITNPNRPGWPGGKDKITVNGRIYDVIVGAGGSDPAWGIRFVEMGSPGGSGGSGGGGSNTGGGAGGSPTPGQKPNTGKIEADVRKSWRGLPPRPKSLKPLVAKLVKLGYQAKITNPNRPGWPGGKDKITVNGIVYDVIRGAGGSNPAWKIDTVMSSVLFPPSPGGDGLDSASKRGAIKACQAGLKAAPGSLNQLAACVASKGFSSRAVIHGRAGYPGPKDKIDVDGARYDVIVGVGSSNPSWGAGYLGPAPGVSGDGGGGTTGGRGSSGGSGTGGGGGQMPLPDGYGIVRQLAAERPDMLENSCQKEGGNWQFMEEAVRRLQAMDPRFGFNWKRGNVGDPSMDAIAYHYGNGPAQDSQEVYVIDIIVAHCSSDRSPGWTDVTQPAGGAIGRWSAYH